MKRKLRALSDYIAKCSVRRNARIRLRDLGAGTANPTGAAAAKGTTGENMKRANGDIVFDRWWPWRRGLVFRVTARRTWVRWDDGETWDYDVAHTQFLEALPARERREERR